MLTVFALPVVGYILFMVVLFAFVAKVFMIILRIVRQVLEASHEGKIIFSAYAQVVGKRQSVSIHVDDDGMQTGTTTHYHATFLLESGQEMAFQVPQFVYDTLCEGDIGELQYRGTQFISFHP